MNAYQTKISHLYYFLSFLITESINLLARSLVSNLEPGDEILLSAMEHHSNIVPWQMMAEKFKVKIKYLPIDKIGELDLNNSEQYFTSRTKIVSITHISNVLGTINPIEDLAKMVAEEKADDKEKPVLADEKTS